MSNRIGGMLMNISFKSTFKSTLSILFAVTAVFMLLFGGSQGLLANEGKYIMVTLKDNTEVKFEYDSFDFGWTAPQIKEDMACKTHAFALDEIVEIYILNQTLDACSQKDNQWAFDVYLKDKKPVQGFIELKADKVTGLLFGTDTEKSISYSDINKVSYH